MTDLTNAQLIHAYPEIAADEREVLDSVRTLFAIEGHWLSVSDRDARAIAIYSRHYSTKKNGKTRDDWLRHGFVGNGPKLVLLSSQEDAIFAWLNAENRLDGEMGANCTVFRNEGSVLSSDLVREADDMAWAYWPETKRHFTYVDASQVRPKRDPGRCFLRAGWTDTRRVSGRGLRILEICR